MYKWIAGGGTLLVGITAILTFWSTYGWITRTAYATDHTNIPTTTELIEIKKLLVIISDKQDINQDQWECDEMDEEIPELQKELAEAETVSEQIDIKRDIAKQDERWIKLDCAQFTE